MKEVRKVVGYLNQTLKLFCKSVCFIAFIPCLITSAVKGPLKYLVAKLYGCYPSAISLPVTQNFSGTFFGAGPSPIQVAGTSFFTSLQQTQEKLLVYISID